ncbi:hypothetical protein EAH79_02875 [Sphingomonas koreensis]|nr:hypothetical protein EAH79_02875 [Sphingomonas koreensis]
MMKKFLLSAIAVSMIASPMLAAAPAEAAQRHQTTVVKHKANGRTVIKQKTQRPNRQVVRRTVVNRAPQVQYRSWARGQRFDAHYARNYQVVNNYRGYRGLYQPPRGYHWVRSGNDAVLVALTGGLIGAVIGGAFN